MFPNDTNNPKDFEDGRARMWQKDEDIVLCKIQFISITV